jgi:hypothetical protein
MHGAPRQGFFQKPLLSGVAVLVNTATLKETMMILAQLVEQFPLPACKITLAIIEFVKPGQVAYRAIDFLLLTIRLFRTESINNIEKLRIPALA